MRMGGAAHAHVIGLTRKVSGPRANQPARVRGEERKPLARLGKLRP